MSVLRNQCCSLKDYKIVVEIFVDNCLEVEYFDENKKAVILLSVTCSWKQKVLILRMLV
jgi:hypothetical protein